MALVLAANFDFAGPRKNDDLYTLYIDIEIHRIIIHETEKIQIENFY